MGDTPDESILIVEQTGPDTCRVTMSLEDFARVIRFFVPKIKEQKR